MANRKKNEGKARQGSTGSIQQNHLFDSTGLTVVLAEPDKAAQKVYVDYFNRASDDTICFYGEWAQFIYEESGIRDMIEDDPNGVSEETIYGIVLRGRFGDHFRKLAKIAQAPVDEVIRPYLLTILDKSCLQPLADEASLRCQLTA